jgi:hypothetical protein
LARREQAALTRIRISQVLNRHVAETVDAPQNGDPGLLDHVLGELRRDIAASHPKHRRTVAAHQRHQRPLVPRRNASTRSASGSVGRTSSGVRVAIGMLASLIGDRPTVPFRRGAIADSSATHPGEDGARRSRDDLAADEDVAGGAAGAAVGAAASMTSASSSAGKSAGGSM